MEPRLAVRAIPWKRPDSHSGGKQTDDRFSFGTMLFVRVCTCIRPAKYFGGGLAAASNCVFLYFIKKNSFLLLTKLQ